MKKALALLLTLTLALSAAFMTPAVTAEDASAGADKESRTAALAGAGNLAYGKDTYTYWSQHETEEYGRHKVTDGDVATGIHGGDGPMRGHWLAVDLGTTQTFDTVELWQKEAAAMFGNFKLVAFDDLAFLEGKSKDDNINDIKWGDIVADERGRVIYEGYDAAVDEDGCYTAAFPAVTARLVVVCAMTVGNAPWNSFLLSEIGVFSRGYEPPKSEETNLLAGVEAAASSSHEDTNWSAAKLTDGDRYNFNAAGEASSQDYGQYLGWHSSLDLAAGDTVTLDFALDGRKTLDRVVIYPASDKYTGRSEKSVVLLPQSITVELSDDGESYHPVATLETAGISEYRPLILTLDPDAEGGVQGAFLRLTLVRGEGHMQFSEVEAYAASGEAPDPGDSRLSTENAFRALLQTRQGSDGTHDLRLVLVTNLEKINALGATFTVKVDILLTTGAHVKYDAKLAPSGGDYTLFRSLLAAGERFEAAEGCALFGDTVIGVPDGIEASVSVTIVNDATGKSVLEASARINAGN